MGGVLTGGGQGSRERSGQEGGTGLGYMETGGTRGHIESGSDIKLTVVQLVFLLGVVSDI